MAWEINYEDADIAELKNLKTLATRPVVIDAMEKLLKDCQQHIQTRRVPNASKSSFSTTITNTTTAIREPISRSKVNKYYWLYTLYSNNPYSKSPFLTFHGNVHVHMIIGKHTNHLYNVWLCLGSI